MSRFAFCSVTISPLRLENRDPSEMVSQLLFGEIVELAETQGKWSKVTSIHDNYEGWCDAKHLLPLSEKEVKRWLDGLDFLYNESVKVQTPWGKQNLLRGSFFPGTVDFNIGNFKFSLLDEVLDPPLSVAEISFAYLNTPYLWGGKSPFGIDCSGFSQQVFRFLGKNLPRDAYQQEELGVDISFAEVEEGDLAFFQNDAGKVTHVGIMLDNKRIIHASSKVRIDELREDGIYTSEGEKTHHFKSVKRV